MEKTEVQNLFEQQESDEFEEGLITRRKNGDLTTKNGASIAITNGDHQEPEKEKEQEQIEDEDEKVKDFSGIKVDEHEKEKEKIEYSVYYDTDKGIWKCRICPWDNQGRNCLTHHNQHPNQHTRMLVNVKTILETKGNGESNVVENTNGEHQKHNEIAPEKVENKTEINEIEVIKDEHDDEIDVETVLKKQETHDLFCPNCNSCITKRVILRKRKRGIKVNGDNTKRNKPESDVFLSDNQDLNEVSDPSLDYQREPDVFRCLSCFSIFMPTGNGFRLFRMFGNKDNETSQKELPVKKNWFSNIFASDKVENNESVQGLEANSHTTNGTTHIEKNKVKSATSGVESNSTNTELADTQERLLTSYHTETESNGQTDYPGMFVVKPPFNNNNVESDENSNSNFPLEYDGLKLVIPPNVGSLVIDNSQMNQELDVTVQTNNPDLGEKGRANLSFSPPPSILGLPTINEKMDKNKVPEVPQQQTFVNNVEIHPEELLKVNKDILTDKQIKLLEDLKNIERIKGKDTIITIESKQPDVSSVQRSPPYTGGAAGAPVMLSGSPAVVQGGVTPVAGGRSLDIIKSIVYGGLMELIASLSVVASAVGSDAKTVNVLALGLANIFGGLFVISHDLWDLKNERTRKTEDRYKQLLGQRTNFPIHMSVSLLSYLVFGFLPPLVYGFSFRESNDKDLKLLMVASASIVCIIILAAAKAYVQSQRKSYFKTIGYYVVFGFMVSGVSYLFGELVMKLLEKMDVFDSGSVVNLSVYGVSPNRALADY